MIFVLQEKSTEPSTETIEGGILHLVAAVNLRKVLHEILLHRIAIFYWIEHGRGCKNFLSWLIWQWSISGYSFIHKEKSS